MEEAKKYIQDRFELLHGHYQNLKECVDKANDDIIKLESLINDNFIKPNIEMNEEDKNFYFQKKEDQRILQQQLVCVLNSYFYLYLIMHIYLIILFLYFIE